MFRLSIVFLLLCLPISCLIASEYGPCADFNATEYKSIARIISSLTYNIEKDQRLLNKQLFYDQIIWDAFIWRFYKANDRNRKLYFPKLIVEFDKIPLRFLKALPLLVKKKHASPLVINSALFLNPNKYSDKELRIIKEFFLSTQDKALHKTTFFILLITHKITPKSAKVVLAKLSS